MPYTAAPGPGLFGTYSLPDSRPRIDIGSVLGALGQGVGSIVHQHLLMKQAAIENSLRQAQAARDNAMIDIERQREARAAEQQAWERNFRQMQEQHRFIEAGGIPAQAIPGSSEQVPITPVSPSPLGRSPGAPTAIGNFQPTLTPGSSGLPVAPPQSATVSTPTQTIPESYDPTRSAAYARSTAIADLRNQGLYTRAELQAEGAAQRSAAHDQRVAAMRAAANRGAQAIAKMKIDARGATPIKSAALSAQAERGRLAAASDVINNAGGSLDEATAFLAGNDPAAKTLRDNGVTPYHLMQAHSQYVSQTAKQAMGLQSGALGVEPDSAVMQVDSTRKLLGRPRARLRAPASDSTYSDDEIANAMKAGKTTPGDVRAYITQQRQQRTVGKLPPLTDAQTNRIKQDPQYKQFKQSQGYVIP
jgi:hypothetical protein